WHPYTMSETSVRRPCSPARRSATSSVQLTCGHRGKYAMASAHVGPGTCRRRPVPAGEYDGEEVAHAGRERSAIRVAGDREAGIVLQRAGGEPRNDGARRAPR